ncbi:T9SS type A sorting domain-containing protein [candidate division KSB1 bacterium]|nr:T9SS type A sorting domain-containing protein [candidate division KSB1 bacterium]
MYNQPKHASFITTMLLIFPLLTDAFSQGIYLDFGITTRAKYMQNVGNSPGSDGEIIGGRVGNEFCVQSVGKAIYFAIDNEKLYQRPSYTSDIINVEYYDASAREIVLIYDSIDDANKVSEALIKTTGSNTWKSAIFYLEDSYFSDRQKYNADFRLECADTMTINVVRVAPVDYYINFGEINEEGLIAQKMIRSGDSMTEIVVIDDEECIITTEESQYIYCDIDDDEIFEGNFPEYFISVEYYDSDYQSPMRLQYDSENEPYKDTAWIQGKGWDCFRTYTWEVSDGYMGGRQNDGADFRLNFQHPGPAINRIMLGFLDYGPSAVKNSPTVSATDFLQQNYPNPFNPATIIQYSVGHDSHISLKIYNLRGELVRTLVDGERSAGVYSHVWDGRDNSNATACSGLYVYRLVMDDFSQCRKMIKLQ